MLSRRRQCAPKQETFARWKGFRKPVTGRWLTSASFLPARVAPACQVFYFMLLIGALGLAPSASEGWKARRDGPRLAVESRRDTAEILRRLTRRHKLRGHSARAKSFS